MKTAITRLGESVRASDAAPEYAYCPKCGGSVMLRARKLMANAGYSYYFQHSDNDHPCERQKPFMRLRLVT